jgi:hypothetical protein
MYVCMYVCMYILLGDDIREKLKVGARWRLRVVLFVHSLTLDSRNDHAHGEYSAHGGSSNIAFDSHDLQAG